MQNLTIDFLPTHANNFIKVLKIKCFVYNY